MSNSGFVRFIIGAFVVTSFFPAFMAVITDKPFDLNSPRQVGGFIAGFCFVICVGAHGYEKERDSTYTIKVETDKDSSETIEDLK